MSDRLENSMNIEDINRIAWDEESRSGNYWSRIATEDEIKDALQGNPMITVTPSRSVPLDWIRDTKGNKTLLLAGAGGQQTPILAAYGSLVTTVDQSEGQLNRDKTALEKYNLKAELIQEDIRTTGLAPESFDFALNPVSLNFIDDIKAVYDEAHRVLKKDGIFIFGIANPILYAFDDKCQERKLKIKYTLPFSDTGSLSKKELERRVREKDTLEFSHTLDSIIGGLLHSGFIIEDFYSDKSLSEPTDSFVHDSFMAFKARRT